MVPWMASWDSVSYTHLMRVIKTVFSFYPVMLPSALLFILLNAIISSSPSVFMQNIIALGEQSWKTGDWASVAGQSGRLIGILVVLYVLRHRGPVAGFPALFHQGDVYKRQCPARSPG